MINSLLNEVKQYCLEQNTDRALRLIFQWMNDQLIVENSYLCNELLTSIDVNDFDEDILVGFMASTFLASHLLPARSEFCDRVMKRLEPEIGLVEAQNLIEELK